MFPSTFSTVSMIIGVIWMIQGFGAFDTGSFMDGQSFWGWMGVAIFSAGLVGFIVKKRRDGNNTDG